MTRKHASPEETRAVRREQNRAWQEKRRAAGVPRSVKVPDPVPSPRPQRVYLPPKGSIAFRILFNNPW